ncbi:MAG: hypothetical protein U9Q21_02430 [Candidatus Auribacterota bacterium]|nr:hypothetical protein [Candidatus Auribacterota bacterium]
MRLKKIRRMAEYFEWLQRGLSNKAPQTKAMKKQIKSIQVAALQEVDVIEGMLGRRLFAIFIGPVLIKIKSLFYRMEV